MDRRTKESQYQPYLDQGRTRLGIMINAGWRRDPKRLLFMLARYKFVAKMLSGTQKVLEVGCGDAFATRLVAQEVGRLMAVDFDPIFIEDIIERQDGAWPFTAICHDMLDAPIGGPGFDAAYSLDVLEHIAKQDEHRFLDNIAQSLKEHGAFIAGMPSLESQPHASEDSKAGHVNCKSMPDFRATMQQHFHNVFMFSMNDEVVHTGFHPMAHYLFAVCAGPK